MKKKALVLCAVISLLMSSVSVNATEITEAVNTEIVTEATEMSVETTTEDVTTEEVTEAASEETIASETETIPEVTTENEEVLQGVSSSDIKVSGVAHVQGLSDVKGVWDSQTNTLKMGTTGQSKRLEAITLNLENNTGYEGSMWYSVHRQTYGWTDGIWEGNQAGTTGEAKRLEGIRIYLTGELAKHYSVRYRVHIQSYGWSQGWQYDGAMAGTEGEAKRLEALEIQIVPRTEEMGVTYRVHRQTTGWEKTYSKNGEVAGTTGQGKRLEAIEIALTGNEYVGEYDSRHIRYQAYAQSYGWDKKGYAGEDEIKSPLYGYNGGCAGTIGKGKRMEAITISIGAVMGKQYDIYYRVHAQSYGWLGWAKNGEVAGTAGYGKRLEAIQIVLKRKGEAAPGEVYNGVKQDCKQSFIANTSTKDVAEYVRQYGYWNGNGGMGTDCQMPLAHSDGRFFEVWAYKQDVAYIYEDGNIRVSIAFENNKYYLDSIGITNDYNLYDDSQSYYDSAGFRKTELFASDNGYEVNSFQFKNNQGAVSDSTNEMLNGYVKDAVDGINDILQEKGFDKLKR